MKKIIFLLIFNSTVIPFAKSVDQVGSKESATDVLTPIKIGVLDKAKNVFWKTFTGKDRIFPIFGKAIFDAAKNGNVNQLKNLLINKENIEAEDEDGWTSLLWAINNRHLPFVEILLNESANINNKGGSVYNPYPLSLAVKNNQPEVVKILLSKNPNTEVQFQGKTPLILAAELGYTEIAKDLLDHKAQVDAAAYIDERNRGRGNGITALEYAVNNGNEALVQLLLERGANTDKAMAIAKDRKKLAIMNLLRKWSITSQKRLSDADVARLGPGEATAYYNDFSNYVPTGGQKALE